MIPFPAFFGSPVMFMLWCATFVEEMDGHTAAGRVRQRAAADRLTDAPEHK